MNDNLPDNYRPHRRDERPSHGFIDPRNTQHGYWQTPDEAAQAAQAHARASVAAEGGPRVADRERQDILDDVHVRLFGEPREEPGATVTGIEQRLAALLDRAVNEGIERFNAGAERLIAAEEQVAAMIDRAVAAGLERFNAGAERMLETSERLLAQGQMALTDERVRFERLARELSLELGLNAGPAERETLREVPSVLYSLAAAAHDVGMVDVAVELAELAGRPEVRNVHVEPAWLRDLYRRLGEERAGDSEAVNVRRLVCRGLADLVSAAPVEREPVWSEAIAVVRAAAALPGDDPRVRAIRETAARELSELGVKEG